MRKLVEEKKVEAEKMNLKSGPEPAIDLGHPVGLGHLPYC
jgi:hypothetical protein